MSEPLDAMHIVCRDRDVWKQRAQEAEQGALAWRERAERLDELTAWANSRIKHCREQEEKFGGAWEHRPKHQNGPPQALVEAWTERRSLQAVLRMLGKDDE